MDRLCIGARNKEEKMTSLEVKDRPSTHSQNNMPSMAQVSSLKGRINVKDNQIC